MSYLVLARKWRPQTFADIAGQGHITRTLQNAVRANRIAHAYLFTGVRGVGKTTAARVFAKALNCEKGPTPDPCNECPNCREIAAGNSIDVLEIDGASNRGIDEIRQIIESIRYQPAKSRFKIYIIDEVHQVTKDAFNALLKTLEEPPPSAKFILATTEPHRLPETILSRCQRFDFHRIGLREIVQRLNEISAKEGLSITEGALVLLAREADGSMRDAQSLLEQVLACAAPVEQGTPTEVDEQLLQEILGIAERQTLYSLSAAVIDGNAKRCLEVVSQAVAQGRDLCRLSKDLVEHFRNLLVVQLVRKKNSDECDQLVELPDQEIAELKTQAADLSTDTLLDYFDFMAAGDEEIAEAANPRFALEATLVRLATLPKTLPVAAVLDRLEKLEKRLRAENGSASIGTVTAVAPPPKAAVEAVRNPVKTGIDKEKLWGDFVAFVGREKKFLATHLQTGRPLAVTADQLEIGVAERHHLAYLQDTETLADLKALAKRFFAKDLAIRLTQVGRVEGAEVTGEPIVAEPTSDTVKEALRIFGGTIRKG